MVAGKPELEEQKAWQTTNVLFIKENKMIKHNYKPRCENHDEYCSICLKDENDPIHQKQTSSFDVQFVKFCNDKSAEYRKKCKEIEKKKKHTWYLDKEWKVMWHRWGYYVNQAQREVNQSNKGEIK
jgi:hypothetical protein